MIKKEKIVNNFKRVNDIVIKLLIKLLTYNAVS